MTDRPAIERPRSDAHAGEPTVQRKYQNPNTAEKHLADVPFVLYCARESARHFWSLVCRKYPELREWR